MEIDYVPNAQAPIFMTVNDGDQIELDLNGSDGARKPHDGDRSPSRSSTGLPASMVIPVQLKAGSNTIRFGNAQIQRSWTLDMANSRES